MKKILFPLLLLPFLTTSTLADNSFELKCYSNEELTKMVKDLPVLTMYKGKNKDGKTEDMVFNLEKKEMYTIQYTTEDGNALAAKQYCVTNIDKEVSVNMSFVEFFSKLMDRYKGQKI